MQALRANPRGACSTRTRVQGHESRRPTPSAGEEAAGPSLRLRPLEGEEAPRVADHLLAPPAHLKVRPAEAEPRPRLQSVSDPDSDAGRESDASQRGGRSRGRGAPHDYTVLDPFHVSEDHGPAGPPPLWMLLPSLTARALARQFRMLRDRLYVVSLFFLVLVLIGYLFQLKFLLHLGVLGVIAANIVMLGVGVAYLVTLPFKEGLWYGLANLLVPFYALYYWITRWPRMKPAVHRTLGSFLPILLVTIACIAYEEAPVVDKAVEKEFQALEKEIPGLDQKVEQVLQPLEKKVGPLPGSEPEQAQSPSPRARRPARGAPPY